MFNTETWLGNVSTGFYKLLLDQSIKFNEGDSSYLRRAIVSAGDRTKSTFSCWFKISGLSGSNDWSQTFYNQGNNSGSYHYAIGIYNNTIYINDYDYGSSGSPGSSIILQTNRVFRDTSAWYHLVVRIDTTQATAADRARVYINGVQETSFSTQTINISQSANMYVMNHTVSDNGSTSLKPVRIGNYIANYNDGYMAEINYCDGQSLGPDSFGVTKNGIWTPIDTSGLTFGTNGFHLTFKDDVVSEGFNTVTYTGTGAAQSISGVGFSPGLAWIKGRSTDQHHNLFDVLRSDSDGPRRLYSSLTTAEESTVYSGTTNVSSLDADGFTMGNGTSVNESGKTFVGWCWEAGGTPTADNSAGTSAVPTSNSAKVDGSNHGSALSGSIAFTRATANTTKGFSIVTYTGNGSAGATVDHLLGDTLDWYIVKRRDSSASWQVFHTSLGATKFIDLHSNGAAETNTNRFNDTAPTSSVVSLGTNSNVNSNGGTFVMYCWAGKSGYSSFGTYSGSGSSGKAVTGLGFRPAWLMIRRTDNTGAWAMFDNMRGNGPGPSNTGGTSVIQYLQADKNNTEGTSSTVSMSFDSDGFTVGTSNTDSNASGGTYIYMAFADTREAAFFKDVSTNGNNWTPVNLDYRDSVPDVPTNNFCTANPLHKRLDGTVTISEGNLQISAGASYGGDNRFAGTTGVSSGKWYFEMLRTDSTGIGNQTATGVFDADTDLSSGQYSGNPTSSGAATNEWALTDRGYACNGSTYTNLSGTIGTVTQGKVVQVAVDMDNKKIWFGIDNTFSGDPAAGSGEAFSNLPTTILTMSYTAESTQVFNFGQDSSFSGNKSTANSNADANGHGSFAYAPPSGSNNFLALCSQNLPDPAIIDGTEHFETNIWTANGSDQTISTSHDPDFLWYKTRNQAYDHYLVDALRGVGGGSYALNSNNTDAEGGGGNADNLGSGNFSINVGGSGDTAVGWTWNAGGSNTTNDASSTGVGTIDSVYRANTTAGFSIVSYTGTGSAGTIAHGLSAAPEMLIIKERNATSQWVVGHHNLDASAPFDKGLYLDDTRAVYDDASNFNDTAPTSTVFSVGTGGYVNDSSNTYIAYIFHSVESYSKVGSFLGNGNADGTFVFTGMAVSWLMVKRTDTTGNWAIYDKTRDTTNVMGSELFANLSNAEQSNSSDIDFLSNGFKFRRNYSENNSSGSYIYLAIGSQPQKFSNAR